MPTTIQFKKTCFSPLLVNLQCKG